MLKTIGLYLNTLARTASRRITVTSRRCFTRAAATPLLADEVYKARHNGATIRTSRCSTN